MPPKGRPPKKKRNISGLKNQPTPSEAPLPPIIESTSQNVGDDQPDEGPNRGEDQPPNDLKDMASSKHEDDLDSDFESDHERKGLTSREPGKRLAALSCKIDDNPDDADWIPYRSRRKKGKKKERPTSYIKGPDVMSKSLRSRQRYTELFKDQTQLNVFFEARPSGSMIPQARRVSDRSTSSEESEESVEIIRETHTVYGDNNREGSVEVSTVPEPELTVATPENSSNQESEDELSDEDEEASPQSPERQ